MSRLKLQYGPPIDAGLALGSKGDFTAGAVGPRPYTAADITAMLRTFRRRSGVDCAAVVAGLQAAGGWLAAARGDHLRDQPGPRLGPAARAHRWDGVTKAAKKLAAAVAKLPADMLEDFDRVIVHRYMAHPFEHPLDDDRRKRRVLPVQPMDLEAFRSAVDHFARAAVFMADEERRSSTLRGGARWSTALTRQFYSGLWDTYRASAARPTVPYPSSDSNERCGEFIELCRAALRPFQAVPTSSQAIHAAWRQAVPPRDRVDVGARTAHP